MPLIYCRTCGMDEPALVSVQRNVRLHDTVFTLVYRCGVRLLARMTDEEAAQIPSDEFARVFCQPAALAEYIRERWDRSLDALPG